MNEVTYFDVLITDRVTHDTVVVGSLLSRFEAAELRRILIKYDVDFQVIEYKYHHGKEVFLG